MILNFISCIFYGVPVDYLCAGCYCDHILCAYYIGYAWRNLYVYDIFAQACITIDAYRQAGSSKSLTHESNKNTGV